MSKDMNVTIWPIWEAIDGTPYADKADRLHPANVGYEVYRRRLTDTELAAEYWLLSSRRQRMLGYHYGPNSETLKQARTDEARMKTVEKFASLPHASDNNYQ